MIILDTHIWVNWILIGDSGLTKPILAAMNSQSSMAVSAISCFEVSLLVKQRKLELPLPINEWLKEALTESGVNCLPVTCEISHLSVTLKDIHKDPADRIIISHDKNGMDRRRRHYHTASDYSSPRIGATPCTLNIAKLY